MAESSQKQDSSQAPSMENHVSSSQSDNVENDSDWTSSSGSSSEDEDEDEDEDQTTQTTRTIPPNENLKSRLVSFLPQMEKANKELADPTQALKHQIDDVDEDEEHVEMNLGLGVLSEKQQSDDEIRVHQSDTEDSEHEKNIITNKTPSAKKPGKVEEISS